MTVCAVRTTRKFAFFPRMMHSRIVWLRFYYVDEEIKISQYVAPGITTTGTHYVWTPIDEYIRAKS